MEQISTFIYNPDAALSFELWYSRYEDILAIEGKSLDAAARTRLCIQKLDQGCSQKFDAHALYKKCSELGFDDAITHLKELSH